MPPDDVVSVLEVSDDDRSDDSGSPEDPVVADLLICFDNDAENFPVLCSIVNLNSGSDFPVSDILEYDPVPVDPIVEEGRNGGSSSSDFPVIDDSNLDTHGSLPADPYEIAV